MKDLFTEFMTLSYSEGEARSGIKDRLISEYILCRLSTDSLQVIYLTNGTKIVVPWKYIDTFSSFNTLYGYQALHRGLPDDEGEIDKIDKVIYNFLILLGALAADKGQLILSVIINLCSLGTREFRDWVRSEFEVDFEPIQVSSVDSELRL